eukprot:CAMPEP_0197579902 /NCGR_PEP_ID=MMETSP1326-20131121/3808_1 /TAXON_ID=1155430 /ORGANISM="Genus nov. species nov., Strain RCC2288" /LENGTH=155 /DNA_ID=CAMNT_0043143489 /DNA_START=29 /DNA_END=492 /DNA_ORIENTATION=-
MAKIHLAAQTPEGRRRTRNRVLTALAVAAATALWSFSSSSSSSSSSLKKIGKKGAANTASSSSSSSSASSYNYRVQPGGERGTREDDRDERGKAVPPPWHVPSYAEASQWAYHVLHPFHHDDDGVGDGYQADEEAANDRAMAASSGALSAEVAAA